MDERHLARLTASVRELDLLDELRSAAAVIVGYSGGADSSLLLEYLFEMSPIRTSAFAANGARRREYRFALLWRMFRR